MGSWGTGRFGSRRSSADERHCSKPGRPVRGLPAGQTQKPEPERRVMGGSWTDPRGIILTVPQMQPHFLGLCLLAWEPLTAPSPAEGGGMDGCTRGGLKLSPPAPVLPCPPGESEQPGARVPAPQLRCRVRGSGCRPEGRSCLPATSARFSSPPSDLPHYLLSHRSHLRRSHSRPQPAPHKGCYPTRPGAGGLPKRRGKPVGSCV